MATCADGGGDYLAPTIDVLLRRNGDEQLEDRVRAVSQNPDEDPPIFFAWERVDAFVASVNAVQQAPAVPPPFPLPQQPILPSQFKVCHEATRCVTHFRIVLLQSVMSFQ
jgi:hypothetical protein